MKLSDLQTKRKANMTSTFLFSGESGTRKTSSIASFPGPILLLDVDLKAESLLNFCKRDDIDIERYGPEDTEKIDKKFKELEQRCIYKTVALDGLSFITGMSLNYGYSLRGTKPKPGNRPFSGVVEVSTLEDYLLEAAYIKQVLDYLKTIFKNHGVNVILTAHVKPPEMTKDKDGNMTMVTSMARLIMTAGKNVAPLIPASFNEVFHFSTVPPVSSLDATQFVVSTVHTGLDYARTTLPLPAKMNITNKPLWDYIKEAMEKQ